MIFGRSVGEATVCNGLIPAFGAVAASCDIVSQSTSGCPCGRAWWIGRSAMETTNYPAIRVLRPAWNKDRIVGQKRPVNRNRPGYTGALVRFGLLHDGGRQAAGCLADDRTGQPASLHRGARARAGHARPERAGSISSCPKVQCAQPADPLRSFGRSSPRHPVSLTMRFTAGKPAEPVFSPFESSY